MDVNVRLLFGGHRLCEEGGEGGKRCISSRKSSWDRRTVNCISRPIFGNVIPASVFNNSRTSPKRSAVNAANCVP